ncbi:hypothetical protein ABTO49_21660, partial [Acinetobacter baumannii]
GVNLLISASLLVATLSDPFAPNNYEVVAMVNAIHLPSGTPYQIGHYERDRRALLSAAMQLEIVDNRFSPYVNGPWMYGPGSF